MNDFSGNGEAPTFPTVITGVRAFNVSPTLAICSPMQPHTWVPGTNSAVCKGKFYLTPHESLAHRVASMDCSCGFYAYFDTENRFTYLGAPNYNSVGGLIGIIQGSGRVTFGSDGFRAEKAKIVALIRPPQEPGPFPVMPPQPDVRKWYWWSALWIVFWVSGALVTFLTEGWWVWLGTALSWAGLFGALYTQRRMKKQRIAYRALLDEWAKDRTAWVSRNFWYDAKSSEYVLDRVIARIAGVYPDIPWYDTIEDALNDFPLSKEEDFLLPEEANG